MLTVYSAFVMVTVGVSLRTVTSPVRVVPCRVAETVTEVSAVTWNALSVKVARTLAERVSSEPKGTNFDVTWAKSIEWRVVSPR